MIKLLAQDTKIGDVVTLFLITGEKIKGEILEYGDYYVKLKLQDNSRIYFQQIIGGWEVTKKSNTQVEEQIPISLDSNIQIEDSSNAIVDNDRNFFDVQLSQLTQEEKEETFASNSIITELKNQTIYVDSIEHKRKGIPIKNVGDRRLLLLLMRFSKGDSIPVYVNWYTDKNNNNAVIGNSVLFPGSVENYIQLVKENIILGNKTQARNLLYIILSKLNKRTKLIYSILNKITKFNDVNVEDFFNAKKEIVEINKLILENNKESSTIIDSIIPKYHDPEILFYLFLKKITSLENSRDHKKTLEIIENDIVIFNAISENQILSQIYSYLGALSFAACNSKQAINYFEKSTNLYRNITSKFFIDLIISIDKLSEIKTDIKNNTNQKNVPLNYNGLIDCDILEHEFVDPEILSLHNKVTAEIAQRIFETAKDTDNLHLYLEAAKAFQTLGPENVSNELIIISKTGYAYRKCVSIYNTFFKIVDDLTINNEVALTEIRKIKDTAIDYYGEFIGNYKCTQAICEELTSQYVKMQICEYLIESNSSSIQINELLNIDLLVLVDSILDSKDENLIISTCCAIIDLAIYCDKEISAIFNEKIVNSIQSNVIGNNTCSTNLIKHIGCTHIKVTEPLFSNIVNWKKEKIKEINKKIISLRNKNLNILSMGKLLSEISRINTKRGYLLYSDRILHKRFATLANQLNIYRIRNQQEQIYIIKNAIIEIEKILAWATGVGTKLCRLTYIPILNNWKTTISKLSIVKEEKINCSIAVSFDPPYYTTKQREKKINMVITNIGNNTIEGFRIAIIHNGMIDKPIVFNEKKHELTPSATKKLSIVLPCEWGDEKEYEVTCVYSSLYLTQWSKDSKVAITLSQQPYSNLSSEDIKWREKGTPIPEMFKGRDQIVEKLVNHYLSTNRHNTYVLYGLSRTGKSSILEYVKKRIYKNVIVKEGIIYKVLPIIIDLGEIVGNSIDASIFWKSILKKLELGHFEFINERKPKLSEIVQIPEDFSSFITKVNLEKIHPIIMFDEFSYMKDAIDNKYINAAFLQLMRKFSAEEDLVSFIYAGTYDIKQLIHEPKYNIAGSSVYLIEPKDPIYEIKKKDAEDLINAMGDKLTFTQPAITAIHKLSGDVPFWIQKICLNCGRYAVEEKIPTIGLGELDLVVSLLTGETSSSSIISILPMSSSAFEKTQTLPSDTREIKIVLTSIAYYLTHKEHLPYGVTYEQLLDLWDEKSFNYTEYNFVDAFQSLVERNTLVEEKIEGQHYYRFSIDLFRRWWAINHDDLSVQFS